MGAAPTPSAAVLARCAEFAAERGLPEVVEFVAALPGDEDRRLRFLASADIDPEPLRRWVAEQCEVVVPPASVEPLEPVGSDPGSTLMANRALVALRCGALLKPDTVDAVAQVVARPPGSFAIVLVGAETLTGEDDLDLVRRGLWRLFLGGPGEEWTGQALRARACMLWTARPEAELPGSLAVEIAQDMRALRDWLRAAPPMPTALDELRAAHAVDLVEAYLARRPTRRGPTAHVCRAIREVRVAAAGLHDRLLARLDADVAGLERQLRASLQVLEPKLINGLDAHLTRCDPHELQGRALNRTVSDYLSSALREWQRDARRLARTRLQRMAQETDDLLDGVDWEFVNTVLVAPPGRRYPAAILDRLWREGCVELPASVALSGPRAAEHPEPAWLPAMRRAAYGGLSSAVSVFVLGPVLVPAIAAGAIGGVGGAAVDKHIIDTRVRRAATSWARAAIAASMAEFSRSVGLRLRTSIQPVRRTVTAAFTELDAGLQEAAERTNTEQFQSGVADRADAALLADLRAELSAERPHV